MLVSASLQGVCVLDNSQQTLCLVERSFGHLESFLAAVLTCFRKLTYAICAFSLLSSSVYLFYSSCCRGQRTAVSVAPTTMRCLPSFLVLGAQKAGSTDLRGLLSFHPSLDGPSSEVLTSVPTFVLFFIFSDYLPART